MGLSKGEGSTIRNKKGVGDEFPSLTVQHRDSPEDVSMI